ncbi:hypothetical protein HK101_003339 [Irineochytrium annulatum]|nr:hypothetical protein HK101_003339 [Irineochytrium annulatum]
MSVNAMDTALRLLPQLRDFVVELKSITVPHPSAQTDLKTILKTVAYWVESLRELEKLQEFKAEILAAFTIADSPSSLHELSELAKRLKTPTDKSLETLIIDHFRDLFEVKGVGDVSDQSPGRVMMQAAEMLEKLT